MALLLARYYKKLFFSNTLKKYIRRACTIILYRALHFISDRYLKLANLHKVKDCKRENKFVSLSVRSFPLPESGMVWRNTYRHCTIALYLRQNKYLQSPRATTDT